MKKISLFLLFFIISLSVFAQGKPNITFKITEISQSEDSLVFTGEIEGTNLNTGGIPESDHATLLLEIPTSVNYTYPVFYEYFNWAKRCIVYRDKCITLEQKNGENIKKIILFDAPLRPRRVWLRYGGIGQWEKKAPNNVKVNFTAKAPLEYSGKKARLHLILTHVIGGPNAYWEGISYHHVAADISLIPTNKVIVPTVGGIRFYPRPPIPTDSCKKWGEEMKKLKLSEKDLPNLKRMLESATYWAKKNKDTIKKLEQSKDGITLSFAGMTNYNIIIEDIQRLKKLSTIQSYDQALAEMSPLVKLKDLESSIRRHRENLQVQKEEIARLMNKIKVIQEYKKCKEKKK